MRRFLAALLASALASRGCEPSVRRACLVITRAAVPGVIGLPLRAFRDSVAVVFLTMVVSVLLSCLPPGVEAFMRAMRPAALAMPGATRLTEIGAFALNPFRLGKVDATGQFANHENIKTAVDHFRLE